MDAAYLIVTLATVAVNAFAAAADFARARFVLANMLEVRVPEPWLPILGALKAAGACGLLIGVLWFKPLALAAATGLVLFFVGAVVTHVRARVFHNVYFPGFFLALALTSLILGATR